MLMQIKSRPKNRIAVLRTGGAARQIARAAITRAVCRSWFLLSPARELPIDAGGEGEVYWEVTCRSEVFRGKL